MTPSFPPSSFYQPRASTFLVFCQILLPPFQKRIFILAAQKFSLSLSPPAPPTFFLSQQQQMKNTFLPFSSHLGKRIFLPQYRFSRCLWPTNSFSPSFLPLPCVPRHFPGGSTWSPMANLDSLSLLPPPPYPNLLPGERTLQPCLTAVPHSWIFLIFFLPFFSSSTRR